MAIMAAFRLRVALPSSRCAAARPQALQASKVGAGSPGPQAGPAPGLPSRKGCVVWGRAEETSRCRARHKPVAATRGKMSWC